MLHLKRPTDWAEIGDLEARRRKLDDLLYDFEDYTEVDGFDEGRFTEIQLTAKSFALDIIDIVKRLKIDGLPITPPPKQTSFPPLPPLPPLSTLTTMQTLSPPSTKAVNNSSHPPRRSSKARSPEVKPATSTQGQTVSRGSSSGKTKPRVTPPSDSSDPKIWRTSSATTISVDQLPPYSRQQQSAGPHEDDHRNMLAQRGTVEPPMPPPQVLENLRRGSSPDILGEYSTHIRPVDSPSSAIDIPAFPMPLTTAWVRDQAVPPAPFRPRAQPVREPMHREVIPENEAVTHDMISLDNTPSPIVSKLSQFSVEWETAKRSLPPHQQHGNWTAPAKGSAGSGISALSNVNSAVSPRSPLLPARKAETLSPPAFVVSALANNDDGLMLAGDGETVSDSIRSTDKFGAVSSKEDCSIGSKSSLYLMKGFCDGAQAFRQGSHWHGVKKLSGYVAVRTVRCASS
jgi:hypothetical protein